MSTTVTSKGQVTIPKPVRDSLGLTPGSRVDFVVTTDGEFVLRRTDGVSTPRKPSRLRGALGSRLINDIVYAELSSRHDDIAERVPGIDYRRLRTPPLSPPRNGEGDENWRWFDGPLREGVRRGGPQLPDSG